MGLKYIKSDGESLVSALTANVSSAKDIINDLQKGVNHLTSQLDDPSSGLSGKAYHAANTLFKQIVVPTLSELKRATTTIQSELTTYKSAIQAFDRHPDPVYDKAEFEHLLDIKRQQKAVTENHINIFTQSLSTALSKTATENLIFEGKSLESVVSHYEKEIQELEEKIYILEDAESRTSSLFEHSLQDFHNALQGAQALKQGSFDSKGNFTFSKNQGMSWYKNLTGKTVDDSLISKKDDEMTLEDLLTGNVSKENQETLEKLKSIAKETGMKLEDIWNMFYKYGKSEYDKAKNAVVEHTVSDDDEIRSYTTTYTDPDSGVQHGVTIIINMTTGKIIEEGGWGTAGEFQASLKKYGGDSASNVRRQFSNKNEQVRQEQASQSSSNTIGIGVQQLIGAIVRAKAIDDSVKTDVEKISGKKYNQRIKDAKKRKEKEKEKQRELQRIKDLQNQSSGGPAYFGH